MKKIKRALVVLAVSTVALTACTAQGGPAQPGAEPNSSNSPTFDASPIRVTLLPTVDVAPLYGAIEDGLFKKAGLNVEIIVAPSSAARVPSLIAGDAEIGLIGTAEAAQAIVKGFPLVYVGAVTETDSNTKTDAARLYVAKDSKISHPAELKGKTVALASLAGGSELTARVALDKSGVDSHAVTFVEIPYSNMLSALESGSVDAASLVEPFRTQAVAAGAVSLMSTSSIAVPKSAQTSVVVSKDYLQGNEAKLRAFMKILNTATDKLKDDPDRVRELTKGFSPIPPDLIDTMITPIFTSEFTAKKVSIWTDLMFEYGITNKPVDASKVVIPLR